ncbi:MAG: hypothetical protein U0R72_12895 [Nakamurella multipartita]
MVNVLDETMNNVCSGLGVGLLGEVGAVDVGDEPEGQVPVGVVPQGLVGHDRAQVAAPIPMLTIARIGLPVCPVHWPDRIWSANAPIRSSTSCTPGDVVAVGADDLIARRAQLERAARLDPR